MTLTFFLGGARSGKSRRAAEEVERLGMDEVVVFVTGRPLDEEMERRIERHRADRPAGWRTVEAAYDLPERLRDETGRVALVDCATVWLANRMLREEPDDPDAFGTRLGRELVAAAQSRDGAVIVVSNEVGAGVVPPTESGRRFRDAQGRLNQEVAAAADRVEWVVAGKTLRLS